MTDKRKCWIFVILVHEVTDLVLFISDLLKEYDVELTFEDRA